MKKFILVIMSIFAMNFAVSMNMDVEAAESLAKTNEAARKAYSVILKEKMENAYTSIYFRIIDANKDGIEDLILKEADFSIEYLYGSISIYSYYNGSVYNVCEGYQQSRTGVSLKSGIYYGYDHVWAGEGWYGIYKWGKGEVTKVAVLGYEAKNSYDCGEREYIKDGKVISKQKYDELCKKYCVCVNERETITVYPVQEYYIKRHCRVKELEHNVVKTRNLKRATFTKNGYTGDTYCEKCDMVLQKGQVIPKIKTVEVVSKNYVYDGQKKTPEVVVKNSNGEVLQLWTDYKLSYSKNRNIGKGQIIITGIGKYAGVKKKTFNITVKKDTIFTVAGYKYKIKSNYSVAFAGVKDKNIKQLTIPQTVKIGGRTFTVTSVGKNALYSNAELRKVIVGKNVKSIGASAFANCEKLNTIIIKSEDLKKVRKNAFKGIKSTATIKIPKKKAKVYRELLANKGQESQVKIIKY